MDVGRWAWGGRVPIVAAGCLLASGLPAAARAPQQKVLKDPGEYRVYMEALGTQEPKARAQAFEAFLKAYPGSIMRKEALQQALAAYQALGDSAAMERTAARLLDLDPNDVRALAVHAFLLQARVAGGDTSLLPALRSEAARGLALLPGWRAPEGMSEAGYQQLRRQMTGLLAGCAGYGALQAKDYAQARSWLRQAVDADPSDLQTLYRLSVAELAGQPLDPAGFWHAARAMQLAGADARNRQAIEQYAKAQYVRFHGSDEGWDALVKAAAVRAEPPEGFAASITPAPPSK